MDELDPKSVLVIAAGRSFAASGAAAVVGDATANRRTSTISDIDPNPSLESVDAAIAAFRRIQPELVIAVGGGSVIDLAKIVRSVAPISPTALSFALGHRQLSPSRTPLVAVPTTAGTGAEVTHFAVMYVEGTKHSIAAPSLTPEHVILDPELTYTMPSAVTASTGLDALSQAIESYWSVRSTDQSKELASRAIELSFANLHRATTNPDPASRTAMAEASHLAGLAIDQTFTTAPHALSYVLSSRYGMPHGHAVAVFLGAVLEYNANVTPDTCSDPRGTGYVQSTVQAIGSMIGAQNAKQARVVIDALVGSLGLKVGLTSNTGADSKVVQNLVDGVNVERLVNNPRSFDRSSLELMLETIN